MATSINTNNVGFTNYPIYDGDTISMRNIDSTHKDQWAWGYNGYAQGAYGTAQYSRGVYYVSRQIYGTTTLLDAYGTPYTGTGLYYPSNTVSQSYDAVTFTNYSVGRSIQVRLEMNIGRATDDATQSIIIRGGTPAATGYPYAGAAPSNGTHSGGTQIYISGGTTAVFLTYIDTIPANTTYTYWHYCGITGGSGGDGCTAWLNVKFYSF
jgi:hypothetical protein